MTFSILARDPQTNAIGGAAATGNLAVGAWVLHAQAGVGVVATQGFSVSPLWANLTLSSLAVREYPEIVVDQITNEDAGRDYRQLIVLDAQGQTAGWTGKSNHDTKAHSVNADIAVAGNWLVNDNVLDAMANKFIDANGDLVVRLLHALTAAADAGGDSRGLMSAAIKVVSPNYPPIDLRIDHSATPINDLQSLVAKTQSQDYASFVARLPTIEDPYRC